MQISRHALALLGWLVVASTLSAAANVNDQVVGPIADGAKYVISPHGVHLATVAKKGSRVNVIVDGVAGPRFDEIVEVYRVIDPRPWVNIDVNLQPRSGPVTFSKDGSRYAYLARLGQEWVLMADNKEILRLPVPENASSVDTRVEFSGAEGKHLLFAHGSFAGFLLWVDGQKWPGFFHCGGGGSEGTIDPLISSDGEHIAYVAQMDADARTNRRAVIVDGKDTGYFGTQLQYLPDSSHLLCLYDNPKGGQTVLLDGKSLFTARQILHVFVPPVGNRLIFALTHFSKDGSQAQGSFLLVDGKPVAASMTAAGNIETVVISPDGKHYAAICGAAPNQFVVIDGKKGQEYFHINDRDVSTLSQGLTFSPDSSKVVYVASTNTPGMHDYLVINDEESDALGNPWFRFSPDGKRLAYGGPLDPAQQKFLLMIDGKAQPLDPGWSAQSFTFSPDGSRFAYEATFHGNQDIVLDGKSTGLAGQFAFSPDSKHLMVWGSRPPPEKRNAGIMGNLMGMGEGGLFVDGQLVYPGADHPSIRHYVFTSDGAHLFWDTTEAATGPNVAPGTYESVIYLDGKPVTRSDPIDRGVFANAAYPAGNVQFANPPSAWRVSADGVLTVLAPVGDSVKRFAVTPASDTSISAMIAEAAEAPAKAAAAAEAAKKAAAEKAAAAKAKTDADAADAAAKAKAEYDARVAKQKADYDAAVAKKKADYDAAIAKRKADYDAAMAKKKADYDAAVAAKAALQKQKQQGNP